MQAKKKLLIVDDKANLCRSLIWNFQRFDYQCSYAVDKAGALAAFSREGCDAVILDIRLGEENGIEVLREFQGIDDSIPVIMLTGYATIPDAVEAIKIGAYDYIQKPAQFDHLLALVQRAIEERLRRLKGTEPAAGSGSGKRLITENPVMNELLVRARKLANSSLPVLICGESGTGKELLAELIHESSSRRTRDLVRINCAAFPESLLENELFGHERGSFTGADSAYRGVFEQADGSTLFLDEISDMSLPTQARILRAIQNQEIRRLGGSSTLRVDVRFIGATNRNMQELIAAGSFRSDLFFRLSAASLEILPLRERREDIPVLCECFLRELNGDGDAGAKSLSEGALELLLDYDWPGNVRELRNVVHYATTIASGRQIRPEDLPPNFQGCRNDTEALDMLDRIEKNRIAAVLKQTSFNKTRAAELLRISRKTLYSKIEKYGIAIPS